MNMNTARLWFEAYQRTIASNPSAVWDRRSPFHPTNRAATIEVIALMSMICDLAVEMQISIVPILYMLCVERGLLSAS